MPKLPRLNMLVTARSTKILASFAMAAFIALSTLMLAMFSHYAVMPMAYLSGASTAIYVVCVALLYLEYWRTFAFVINVTVLSYMGCAVYYVGWDAGFQLTIVVMGILNYYAEYAARTMRIKTLHAANLSLLGMALYLGLLCFSHAHTSPYTLPDDVSFGLQFLWGFIMFTLNIAYLQLFILIARNAEDSLLNRADHDALTALPNRSHMNDYLNRQASEHSLEDSWLAMIDIDDFKIINDTYGHNCGDYVLRSLADLMHNESDHHELCRWGGEEFLMVGHSGNMAHCREELERLRMTIEEHGFWYEEQRLHITVTVGAAPYEGQSIASWVNAADKRLYVGKANGKNQVVCQDEPRQR